MQFLSPNIQLTQQTAIKYYIRLIFEGADAHHAGVASQALARCFCESIPPNHLQRQSIQRCQAAIVRAGIVMGDEPTLF